MHSGKARDFHYFHNFGAMVKWREIPFQIPNNNQVVWVRPHRWIGSPFLAQYRTQQQTFTSSINSIVYPVYAIAVWRPQTV